MRHTRGHTGNRRSHHALKKMNVIKDGEVLRLPHRVDETTGMYRGRRIAPAKMKKALAGGGPASGRKGPDTEPAHEHGHDHAHEHENAEMQTSKGVKGKLAAGSRPKARSGMGGQAS